MILYLDTSSLLKRYVRETATDDVEEWIASADVVATSRVTLAESAAALARRSPASGLTREGCRQALDGVQEDWEDYLTVDLDERLAAEVAWRHRLHGYDAVQLAAALTVERLAAPEPLVFSSFDSELNRAAAAQGLAVLVPSE